MKLLYTLLILSFFFSNMNAVHGQWKRELKAQNVQWMNAEPDGSVTVLVYVSATPGYFLTRFSSNADSIISPYLAGKDYYLRSIAPTKDGGYTIAFGNSKDNLIIRLDQSLHVVFTNQNTSFKGNLNGLTELKDGTYMGVGYKGGSRLYHFNENGDTLQSFFLSTYTLDYFFALDEPAAMVYVTSGNVTALKITGDTLWNRKVAYNYTPKLFDLDSGMLVKTDTLLYMLNNKGMVRWQKKTKELKGSNTITEMNDGGFLTTTGIRIGNAYPTTVWKYDSTGAVSWSLPLDTMTENSFHIRKAFVWGSDTYILGQGHTHRLDTIWTVRSVDKNGKLLRLHTLDGFIHDPSIALASISTYGDLYAYAAGNGLSILYKLDAASTTATLIATSGRLNKVKIFPNPFSDRTHVELTVKAMSFELLDAYGRTALQRELKGLFSFDFDKGTLKAGLYFCRILLEDGSELEEKLMVE